MYDRKHCGGAGLLDMAVAKTDAAVADLRKPSPRDAGDGARTGVARDGVRRTGDGRAPAERVFLPGVGMHAAM